MQIDAITLTVVWARLLSLVNEAGAATIRSSFSSLVRELHDFGCCVFDERGLMLAQSTLGSPGLRGILPLTMKRFLQTFPAESLEPGDVIITNDPWINTGHLNDISAAEPIFYKGRVVGFAGCAVHHLDIGGRLATVETRSVYEEGLNLPIAKLMRAGQENEDIFNIIRANVRSSDKVLGDLRSQLAATHVMVERVRELLDDLGWTSLTALADEILDRSEASMRRAIRALPSGTYASELLLDPAAAGGEHIRLCATVTVRDDEIVLDFVGSSPQSERAVNCTMNVTRGYAMFPVKCLVDPTSLMNEGSMRPVTVTAPEGTILNAAWPAPVWGRTLVGHFLPELVLTALAQAVPERVIAGSGGTPLWMNTFSGQNPDGSPFLAVATIHGGLGARATKDGVSTISFPPNAANVPIEILEHETPLLFESKALTTDSAGPGRFRGGLGQELRVSVPVGQHGPRGAVTVSVRGGHFTFRVAGLRGGESAPMGEVLVNERHLVSATSVVLRQGDRISYRVPGGGGFFDPRTRPAEEVARDVREGYVSPEAAASAYGVVVGGGRIDVDATARLRTAAAPLAETTLA